MEVPLQNITWGNFQFSIGLPPSEMDVHGMLTVNADDSKGFKRGSPQFWHCASEEKTRAAQNAAWIAHDKSETRMKD